ALECLGSTSRNTDRDQIYRMISGNLRQRVNCRRYRRWRCNGNSVEMNLTGCFDFFDQLAADFKDLFTRKGGRLLYKIDRARVECRESSLSSLVRDAHDDDRH